MQKQTAVVDKRFGDEFEGTYEFRQVTQGEYERVLIGYMDALGKVAKQDVLKVNREMLWTGLIKQPESKPLTKDRVVQGQLPYGLSLRLQEAYDRENGLSIEEERFLPLPSSKNEPSQGSPSFTSAENSDGQKKNTTTPAAEPS
jgi:hypothetical protein